ncbi:MAG: 3-oxoacyl-ACP synthase [Bacteroidota bacterium]|nr:3-oxoacyl-ACP synthase [Bacteroidota bacterium]
MNRKIEIYNCCKNYIEQRIASIQMAVDDARAAANEETKSSMGDKYETTRAMMHFEQEKLGTQMKEANKLQDILLKINPELTQKKAGTGSLVITDIGYYYIAIGAGKFEIDGIIYFAVSLTAPLAQQMMGKVAGDKVNFNGRVYNIVEVL